MPASSLAPGCLFALGNPLLDISAEVTPEFLSKYGLRENNAILAEDSHKPMYEEMLKNFNSQFIPGGATLNSVRYCQWLIGSQQLQACTFVGCVARDEYASKLQSLCEKDGVNVQFYHTEEEETVPTGTCAVCITGHNRSLVANLAAADKYDKDKHLKSDAIWALVEKAQFYYSAGFPLTVTPDGMLAIAQHAGENNKVYCLNLSAEFICQFFKEQMSKILPYTDYLFGNEAEAAKFSEANGGPSTTTDMRAIAKWASLLPKENGKRDRVVVITQGLQPVIVASKGEVILEVPVEKLDDSKIVDTNGAGDSFVGGFLAALTQGQSLEKCVQLGNAAATYCIQKPGSVFETEDRSAVLKQAGLE